MISVCMATYNGSRYVVEQVNSILSQLADGDELIVSDDQSTDNTLALLEALQDTRLVLLANTKKLGIIGNFENALKRAKGDYIFLADQDDVWLPSKVKVSMEYLQEFHLVQTDATIVDADLNPLHQSLFKLKGSGNGFLRNLWVNNYVGCTMAFRRSVLEVALPFPCDIPMHDQWLGLIADLVFTTHFVPQPLVLYRRHDLAQSNTGFSSPHSLWAKAKFRINIAKYFFHVLSRRYRPKKNMQIV
jgi:glycosyltransferase involved in cell wall biosynthesis